MSSSPKRPASFALYPGSSLLGYTLAIVLPLVAAWISLDTPALHRIPLALGFAVIAGIGAFFGVGPALLAVASSVVIMVISTRILHLGLPSERTSPTDELVRAAIVFLCTLFIALSTHRRTAAQRRLHATLEELQEQSIALAEAQQAGRTAAWVFHPSNRSATWYSGGAPIFGRPFSEFANAAFLTHLIEPEDLPRVADAFTRTRTTGDPFHVEFRVRWPNGDPHWIEARGVPLPDDPDTWRGIAIDITERKLAEQALVRGEKLAAVGRLASTISHEVNNPLEAITNLLYLANSDPSLSPESRAYLTQASEEIARLANITRLALNFARPHPTHASASASTIADSVLALFRLKCDTRGIAVERDYAQDLSVAMPAHELHQVLTNLISNATDALTAPGSVLRVSIHAAPGDRVILRVEDNGIGIPAASLNRIFDPFYTTKEDTGTGIGLWLARELITKNAGRLTAQSGALAGAMQTAFEIDLPLATPDTTTAPPADSSAQSA